MAAGQASRLVGTILVGALLSGLALPACAQSAPTRYSPAQSQFASRFAEGAFLSVAYEAERAGDPDALAFAARSLLAEIMTRDGSPDTALIRRAILAATEALELAPDHHEANLLLAIGLSLKARGMSNVAAWQSGDGQRSRRIVERVLEADPSNHYAYAFLSVWHVEVIRRGGALGSQMMGASLDKADRAYRKAALLAPDDIGMHWQYARALVALDARRHGAAALEALRAACAHDPRDHVEEVMQKRAEELTGLLRSNPRAAEHRALELL